jgi:hypothetical protein
MDICQILNPLQHPNCLKRLKHILSFLSYPS